jgi:hypothetical protein
LSPVRARALAPEEGVGEGVVVCVVVGGVHVGAGVG